MTHIEEKLYLETVFDAIDEVYQFEKHQTISIYEERLRASLKKLFIPEWFNQDYSSNNHLRKVRSQGEVLRSSLTHRKYQTKSIEIDNESSTSSSENSYLRRRRSTSQIDSDKFSSVTLNNERNRRTNGISTYVSGLERVTQSSTWYKPEVFVIQSCNDHPIESIRSSSSNVINDEKRHRPPISLSNLKLFQVSKRMSRTNSAALRTSDSSSFINNDASLAVDHTSINEQTPMSSTVETNENLAKSDSSSCLSIHDQSSSASYHTAPISQMSSKTDYDTPTLLLQQSEDDQTLSSSGSISNAASIEMLQAPINNLDSVTILTVEEKPAINSPIVVGMENLPLPPFVSSTSTTSSGAFSDKSPSPNDSRPTDSLHWYDDASIETTIHQNSSQTHHNELRDEFFLMTSQANVNNDELLTPNLDEKLDLNSNQIYSSETPSFSPNEQSIMITNLDDILVEDEADESDQHPFKSSENFLLDNSFRRPIQEDILYEVEHENSFSEHSQNASSMFMPNEMTSIKIEPNPDHRLTNIEQPKISSSDQPIKSSPISIPSTNFKKSSPLYVNTSMSNFFSYPKSSTLSNFSLSAMPSYTSKIRQRHFSVGSYYDNKTTVVTLHPIHPMYLLGSSSISPLNRPSPVALNEIHYLRRPQISNSTVNTLSPPLPPPPSINTYIETTNTRHVEETNFPFSSLQRDEPPIDVKKITIPRNEPLLISTPIVADLSPVARIETRQEVLEPSVLVRPKTSRGRPAPPEEPPLTVPAPMRNVSVEKESEPLSTDDDQTTTPHSDLRFIRGTIQRVLELHPDSQSESSINCETFDQANEVNDNDDQLTSLSNSTTTMSKEKNVQQIVVEPVQAKTISSPSKSTVKPETTDSNVKTTNENQEDAEHDSSASNPLFTRSHPNNQLKKSVNQDHQSSEEVDDTLNDIEDEDSQDEKYKRQPISTSDDESTSHSVGQKSKVKKTSQETQTFQRPTPIILTAQSPSGQSDMVQSHHHTRSTVPPIDIVTQMVIEHDEPYDDGQIGEISGDMVIFYDDIEIVEHSSNLSSTESDSFSSNSRSFSNKKPVPVVSAPPVPARTLKPLHLLNQNSPVKQPASVSPARINRTYELEKATVRKKIDIDSMNTMFNRAEKTQDPPVSHRLPSARHFVGKLNSEDSSSRSSSLTGGPLLAKPASSSMVKSQTLPLQSLTLNGKSSTGLKIPKSSVPIRSSSSVGANQAHRSVIPDTNALVKQIQSSLSRNSVNEDDYDKPRSISTKDLRTFVSSTYSPNDENTIDDNGIIHKQGNRSNQIQDEQGFQRQVRLSKSYHNVSEYTGLDQYPTKEIPIHARSPPSKSVDNHLNQRTPPVAKTRTKPINFRPVVSSASFSALPHPEENVRMLSMKWYTGQVSENSEICYNPGHVHTNDLLAAYVMTHSRSDIQAIFQRLQSSNDNRTHAALDDMRLRVQQFDSSKSAQDLHVFMRYLESRLRDLHSKTTSATVKSERRIVNGHSNAQENLERISLRSRASSTMNVAGRETPTTLPRQYGRQHHRSSGNLDGAINGQGPQVAPRRPSESSNNQENPHEFDEMLNTVLGLQKKGAQPIVQNYAPSYSQNREKSTPFLAKQAAIDKTGKRLFESGTYKDPRLIYDGPKGDEKEEQNLETSV